jgi:hypothetical protein
MARLRPHVATSEEARLADPSIESWVSADEIAEIEATLSRRGYDRDEHLAACKRLYAMGAWPTAFAARGVIPGQSREDRITRDLTRAVWAVMNKRRRAAISDWARRKGVPAHLAERRFIGPPAAGSISQQRPT